MFHDAVQHATAMSIAVQKIRRADLTTPLVLENSLSSADLVSELLRAQLFSQLQEWSCRRATSLPVRFVPFDLRSRRFKLPSRQIFMI